MKAFIKKSFVLPVLVAALASMLAARVTAQTFTTLHSFSALCTPCWPPHGNNYDGAWPVRLILLGNTLYGTTFRGGNYGLGTVFKVNTDGTGFTTLQWSPDCSSGNTLYGVNHITDFDSTVFKVNTDGTGFTN